ncbi:WbqC family protein [bacterium]|nr:WbqC family protein [candidate division CSSED10-310 bacterium]
MRCTILQPGYLPWLGFFNQMALSDCFVFFDDVQFDRRGWRNRNRIKTPNGPIWLTVPVVQHGKFDQDLRDTMIDTSQNWARKHIRSIEFSYRNAPFFNLYFAQLSTVLNERFDRLIDLDDRLIALQMDWLNLRNVRTFQSSELAVTETDKTGRLVEICRVLGATEYISGPLCRNYLDLEQFARAGIRVFLHNYTHPAYPQLYGDFVPYMAAIDLVMNCGPESAAFLGDSSALVDFRSMGSAD